MLEQSETEEPVDELLLCIERSLPSLLGPVYLRDDGIVFLRPHEGAQQDVEAAHSVVAAVTELAEGRLVPVLLDGRKTGPMGREAREVFSAGARRTVSNFAILVGSNFSRIVMRAFIRLGLMGINAEVFTDADAAIAWLRAGQSDA